MDWRVKASKSLARVCLALLGVASLAWSGHIVHVALPASRGQDINWWNLTTHLPHPAGLKPFVTMQWAQYAKASDGLPHVFGQADASTGTSILTFLGSRLPNSDSLYLSDVAHHHLAIAVVCILLGSLTRSLDLALSVYRPRELLDQLVSTSTRM